MKSGLTLFILTCSFFFSQPCLGGGIDSYSQSELIQILKDAIEINEKFKKTVVVDQMQEYQERRKEVENYYEDKLSPRFKEYVSSITQNNDIELSELFLEMVISYENSADESLSFTCGELFRKDPNLILDVFDKFTNQEQKYLYKQIEFGWEQIIATDKLSESELVNRNSDLNKLKQLSGSH